MKWSDLPKESFGGVKRKYGAQDELFTELKGWQVGTCRYVFCETEAEAKRLQSAVTNIAPRLGWKDSQNNRFYATSIRPVVGGYHLQVLYDGELRKAIAHSS